MHIAKGNGTEQAILRYFMEQDGPEMCIEKIQELNSGDIEVMMTLEFDS